MQRVWQKRIGVLIMAMLLLCACGGALADAQQDAGINMELPVGSFAELCEQTPDVPLVDAPYGATDVAYSVVGDTPTIAQIKFVLHDRSFCYRAARFNNSSVMPDISGMRNKFDAQMELGSVQYRQDTSSGAGVASWYYESTHSQYSIAIQRGFDAEYMREAVMAMRSQNGEAPKPVPAPIVGGTDVYGTVTSVSATQLTIKGIDSKKYTFSIDASTSNPDAARLRTNAIVRVTYVAPYAVNRLAHKIALIEEGSGTPAKTVSRATKSGTILSRGAERLQIQRPSGSIYTFYTGGAAIYGDSWAGAGDSATVTYYVNDSGTKVATKITYTAAYHPVPIPVPEPWPIPVPNPCPYDPLPQQPVW